MEVSARLSQAVREAELVESSRAAAVVGAQQLLVQASVVDAPSACRFVLTCAASGAGAAIWIHWNWNVP